MNKNLIKHWANLFESEEKVCKESYGRFDSYEDIDEYVKLDDPDTLIEFIRSLPDNKDYIFKDEDGWNITNEWLAGLIAGQAFVGKTLEDAAKQLIEYFNRHKGHKSLVGSAVDNSGWPNAKTVRKYYDENIGSDAGEGIYEEETCKEVVQSESEFVSDEKTANILSRLATQCDDMRKKMMEDRFRVYGYEGQQLANFWLGLGRVADALSRGNFNSDVAEDLDRAGAQIMNFDSHKTPKPTDPRDIA